MYNNNSESFTFNLKSCVILAIWLALISASLWNSFTKTQQPIRYQDLFKGTNQIAGKWKTTFATFHKLAQYWINKIFVKTEKTCMWINEICNFKIDVIKQQLNFVSCNFGLVWLWNSANHFKEHKRSAKKKEPKATASSHFSSVLKNSQVKKKLLIFEKA